MLQSKIRQSFLLTTGLSLFLLALALILICWLGRHALNVARVKAPTVHHNEQLQLAVLESQQNLHEWITMGDARKQAARQEVWDTQIIPSLDELLTLSESWPAGEQVVLLRVRDKIYDLEALQWWVEDSARAAGNRAGAHLFAGEAQSLFEELFAGSSALIDGQSVLVAAGASSPMLAELADLRGHAGAASSRFGEFLLSRDPQAFARCRAHLDLADQARTALSTYGALLPREEQSLLSEVLSSSGDFRRKLEEAYALEQSPRADQARAMIEKEIVPAIDMIKEGLLLIDRRELASLETGGKHIESLTWLAMIGLPLFMIATGFVAVRNARQLFSGIVVPIKDLVKVAEAVNQGNYEERVEVRTNDEVGLLSSTFNTVAESFLEITDVASGVACGDFSRRLDVSDGRDSLRAAINSMNSKLVEVTDQARRIAGGDYSTDFTPMSDRDELGQALRQMTINLRESTALLERSEARSSAVIRTAQDGIVTIGEDRIIRSFNPAAENIFGYAADEIVEQSITRLISHTDNRQSVVEEAPEGGDSAWGRELVARRKDGSTFPILLSIGEAIVDDQRLFTGIVRDLTQEKEAQEELDRYLKEQEDQNWFKSQLSNIYDASQGITDPRVLCKTMLTELAGQLGLGQALFYCLEDSGEAGEELHLYAAYGYRGEDRERVPLRIGEGEGLVGECAHQKEPIVITNVPEGYLRIGSGLGEQTPVEVMILPVLFERNLLGVIELATFRKFTPVQREYLEQVVRTVGAILKGVIEQKRTEELLLVTQEQSEGLRVQQEELRVSNEELKRQTDQLQASEEELRVQQIELAEANSQLKENTSNLEERNELLNARNAELEQAREAIRLKAEELENASKYKSEFLANMSHELRTPLNSILVLANLLRENKQQTLDKKQEKFASVIHQSGNDLLVLINEILDLSKIEAGMLEFEWGEVPLSEIAGDLDDLFGEVSHTKQLNFEIKVADDCPDTLQTDKSRLLQVLKNLISNAFKFTPEGGTVEFSVRRVADAKILALEPFSEAQEVLAIAVRDTGIGIPADKHEAIFESFQQADGSTSRKYGGTGLGLSISRELVHRMGGEVQLESVENKGSTFTVFLPVEGPLPETAARNNASGDRPAPECAVAPASSNGDGPRLEKSNGSRPVPDDRDDVGEDEPVILIVEDNAPFATVVLECAREHGFKGIVAGDGATGLELARRYRLDAVMLDIEMPAVDGWQVLAALRKEERFSSLPIYVMSALEMKERALGLGATDYLQKPVSSERITSVFQKLRPAGISTEEGRDTLVLVIEDDEKQSFAVRELLEGRGFATAAAATGEEALRKLEDSTVQLVILDLGLPDICGLDLLDQIRGNPATERTPVIVLTGREMEKGEIARIEKHKGSIVLKTDNSDQRLLDETALCLRELEEEGHVAKPERVRAASSRDVLENRTVLLVDDDERNINALSSLLEDQLMNVVIGRNGREGLDQLDCNPDVDLVLMDVMMPEMDGYEAIRNIRKQARFTSLPVIAVTAKAMNGDREASLDAGASEYISKPVDVDKLLTLISVWLYK